jgi:hypothetical protein
MADYSSRTIKLDGKVLLARGYLYYIKPPMYELLFTKEMVGKLTSMKAIEGQLHVHFDVYDNPKSKPIKATIKLLNIGDDNVVSMRDESGTIEDIPQEEFQRIYSLYWVTESPHTVRGRSKSPSPRSSGKSKGGSSARRRKTLKSKK